MSRINGEKARAAITRKRRTARRVIEQEMKAKLIEKKASGAPAPPPKSKTKKPKVKTEDAAAAAPDPKVEAKPKPRKKKAAEA